MILPRSAILETKYTCEEVRQIFVENIHDFEIHKFQLRFYYPYARKILYGKITDTTFDVMGNPNYKNMGYAKGKFYEENGVTKIMLIFEFPLSRGIKMISLFASIPFFSNGLQGLPISIMAFVIYLSSMLLIFRFRPHNSTLTVLQKMLKATIIKKP
jgi:hypothetical protein